MAGAQAGRRMPATGRVLAQLCIDGVAERGVNL